jgi:hypothetical protein
VRDVFGPTSDGSRAFWAALVQAGSDVAMRPFGDPRNRDNVERQGTHARVEEAIARLQSLIAVVDERTVWQTAARALKNRRYPAAVSWSSMGTTRK